MNLKQIRSIVKRNTGADTMNMPDYSIDQFINLAQKEVVRQTLTLKKTVAVTTVAAQEQYDLPADFHKSTQMKVGSNFPQYQTEEFIRELYTTTVTTGTPYYYYIDCEAGKYGLFPVPTGVQTGIFMYRALPTVLSADSDEPDIHETYHDLIVYDACRRVSEQLNKFDEATHFLSMFKMLMEDMANDMGARQADIGPTVIQSADILDA